jgi:tRNA pseudouridine38-40 synthase
VRLLVGLLKAVGSKALTTKDAQRILDAQTITATPAMAPACGLYLVDVKYDFTCSNSKEQHTDVADDGLDEFSN